MYGTKDPTPKYIINFDEFVNLLRKGLTDLIMNKLKDKYPQVTTNNLESLLEDLKKLLPHEEYKGLTHTLDLIINNSTINGIQKIEGRLIDVPPLIKDIKEIFQFDKNIYITGFHINQTGWKKEDSYELESKKHRIIDNSFTKETGEHKYFNTYLEVPANVPINFTLKNHSGNSRQTMIDLEYIEKGEPPTPPVLPPKPPVSPEEDKSWLDLITHDFDIAVIMNWEANTDADIDLHGFIGDTHISYLNYGDDTFMLDFDWTSHLLNTNPEIMTVKGHKNESLQVYLHNYKPTLLTKPVNVKIYAKADYKLLKEYNINLINDRTKLFGVCLIDLNTLNIVDLNDTKII